MARRFLLSGVGALLGRKAIAVRDTRPPDPVPQPAVPVPPAEDSERRARALARLILRRAGIAPLLPLFACAIVLFWPQAAAARSGAESPPVRATAHASARARIMPSSVQLAQGELRILRSGAQSTIVLPLQPSQRSCDGSAAVSGFATCRMIVYDLP